MRSPKRNTTALPPRLPGVCARKMANDRRKKPEEKGIRIPSRKRQERDTNNRFHSGLRKVPTGAPDKGDKTERREITGKQPENARKEKDRAVREQEPIRKTRNTARISTTRRTSQKVHSRHEERGGKRRKLANRPNRNRDHQSTHQTQHLTPWRHTRLSTLDGKPSHSPTRGMGGGLGCWSRKRG